MREARSVIVTAWIRDADKRAYEGAGEDSFNALLKAVERAVEAWHSRHENVVDGVPVVKLR